MRVIRKCLSCGGLNGRHFSSCSWQPIPDPWVLHTETHCKMCRYWAKSCLTCDCHHWR